MRFPGFTAFAACTLLSALPVLPAAAQTYSPDYPVCLHVYGPATYYDCRYTSITQCNMSAAGRSAQCVVNPYMASAGMDRPPLRARHPRRIH